METLYSKIGPTKLRLLVDTFYDDVLNDSKIAHLFGSETTQIRDKQFMFLTQFLGGPMLYSQEYGQPKMKIRHLAHVIGEPEKDEWLSCMRSAIDKMDFPKDLGDALYNCFPKVAQHMVNS